MPTTTSPPGPIDLPALRQALRAVDPATLLVPHRILCRVIKRDRGLGGLGLHVPHNQCYIIDRETLLLLASPAELELDPSEALADRVLLLRKPEAVELARVPAEQVLREFWRLLFHQHVHLELGRQPAAGQTALGVARLNIRSLGATVFEEVREVLRQENCLFEGDDVAATWQEFAAVFLELYYFDPHRLPQYFPSIEAPEAVHALLTEELDCDELLRRTRPRGVESPQEPDEAPPVPPPAEATDTTSTEPGVLRLRAEEMARRGNLVRAAVDRLRAIGRAPASQAGVLRAEARRDMERLVARLQAALHLPAADRGDWQRCLATLVGAASWAIWSPGLRLLYDLQKVCIDLERTAYSADLVEWVVSWFRRPITRELPDLPLVLAVKHLRAARARLPVVRLDADTRKRLDELTAAALAHTEERLRGALRPKLLAGLDHVGLRPANAAERISRDKLVEEWLDLVIDRGYLTLGDLRDGLARNQLKLPDIGGPLTFFAGDPLIRLNRDLAVRLDGIYHRGEIYLRWMQRFSSLFFGNRLGRLLTQFAILPLLGSFFILKGVDGLSEELNKFFGVPEVHTFNVFSFAAMAAFLVPMLHWPAFRHAVFRGFWYLWRVVRGLLYDLPAAVVGLPLVRRILQSRTYLAFYQYAGKPAAPMVLVGLLLLLVGVDAATTLGVCLVGALLLSLVLNSRLGLVVEEATADWLGGTWRLVRDDIVPGAFRWITWASAWLLERVDKMLYTVDEALRFRQGDSSVSYAFKLVFGLFWFVVTYVVRLVVNLFIEPQINPIKHFPVVTVSHKLMLLLVPTVGDFVAAWLHIGVVRARATVTFFLALIPGVFGFLAWELKENWRLYRANRSPTLDPEVVGSHGERVVNLLRPGFHSGTLPKLFVRIRRAGGSRERKNEVRRHHVEADLHRFVERDLIAVVRQSKAWPAGAGLAVAQIHVATNQIRIRLTCPAVSSDLARIDLACRSGWLVGGVVEPGFLASLGDDARRAFAHALAGFFAWCGVDFLAERLAAAGDYELTRQSLRVCLDGGTSRVVEYNLGDPEQRVEVPPGTNLPERAADWMYSHRPIRWFDWVACWAADEAGARWPAPGIPPIYTGQPGPERANPPEA